MSNVLKIEDIEELRDLIDGGDIQVVKFTQPSTCRPCRQFAPHYEKAADFAKVKSDDYPHTTFVSVDLDEVPDAVLDYGVRGVPTVMLYQDGEYVVNLQERTAPKLLAEIKSHL